MRLPKAAFMVITVFVILIGLQTWLLNVTDWHYGCFGGVPGFGSSFLLAHSVGVILSMAGVWLLSLVLFVISESEYHEKAEAN